MNVWTLEGSVMVLQFEGGARGVITSCTSCRRSRSGAGLESFERERRERVTGMRVTGGMVWWRLVDGGNRP
jgi:hypothetical protein